MGDLEKLAKLVERMAGVVGHRVRVELVTLAPVQHRPKLTRDRQEGRMLNERRLVMETMVPANFSWVSEDQHLKVTRGL